MSDEDIIIAHREYQQSPLPWISDNLALVPQPIKLEYRTRMRLAILSLEWDDWQLFINSVKKDWFEPFEKGKHITWQQYLICLCVEKALAGKASRKISVVSGRGIGKSMTMAALLLWFLYSFPDSVVPTTAVTADQLSEALWKEVARLHSLLPPEVKELFEVTSDHVFVKERSKTWFARARTASKDRPEALSGIHADWILAEVDEASAIVEKVFEMGQGVLTAENSFLVMFSNGTRGEGYFYRSHHDNRAAYQTLSFSSQDSPVVSREFVNSVIEEYCVGVDVKDYLTVTEYRVNVAGLFPRVGIMDERGYVSLLDQKDIITENLDAPFVGHRIMGVDCGGDGEDKSVWVGRDRVWLKVLHEEQVSTPASIGNKTITLADANEITEYRDIIVDGFGVGHTVGQEVAIITKGKGRISQVNWGEQCELNGEREEYVNMRSMAYWKLRQWIKKGGIIQNNPAIIKDLLNMKYVRVGGKVKIEPKIEMKKRGVKSPDYGDAAALTFLREIQAETQYMTPVEANRIRQLADDYDPHSIFG